MYKDPLLIQSEKTISVLLSIVKISHRFVKQFEIAVKGSLSMTYRSLSIKPYLILQQFQNIV